MFGFFKKHRGMKVLFSRPNASVIEDGRYIEVTLRFSTEAKRQRQVARELVDIVDELLVDTNTNKPDNVSQLSTNPQAQS